MRTRENLCDVLKIELVHLPILRALGLVPLELGKPRILN